VLDAAALLSEPGINIGVHRPFQARISAMTYGCYRTLSPVTALPMIMRWISDVPSKMLKLVEVRAVSAGRWPDS
jgi:hypothetical protein